MRQTVFAAAIVVALCTLSGCDRPSQTPAGQPGADQTQPLPEPVAEDQPVVLEDVVEATSDYLVGISYQGDAERYPGLAKQLKAYADAARDEVIEAAQSRPQGE